MLGLQIELIEHMTKIPYAVRDFYSLVTEGYLYFDRTDKIQIIEELGKELLFLRPRRFGKSLWLSTLMNYYDINKANDFEQLFGHLAIGQNPTPLHNQYMVLKWDFSNIESQGTIREIRTSLYNHIKLGKEIKIDILETGKTITAKISRIGAVIDPSSATLRVEAEIDNRNGNLKAGMSGTAHF